MKFTDPVFLLFFPLVLLSWRLLRSWYWPTVVALTLTSFYFYGYQGEHRLILLAGYCGVDWLVGQRLRRSARPGRWLAAGVGFNLALLCFYKYTPMLTRTLADAIQAAGGSLELPPGLFRDWSIPFGLSFYAFTGIAYLVDVYRRRAPAEPNPIRFSLYLSFFPQLMAGPILRPSDFLNRLQPGRFPRRADNRFEGVHLIGRGLFKKMVLADRIAVAIDPFFAEVTGAATSGVWALPYLYLYALQIFFDFSGYTDMARGMGLLFGFRWPRNFDVPYAALSIRDFWRRWHMTLSRFLRDYLYIPLGGGRKGRLRTGINLMITMLLGGLWHGATWSFMGWGGLHGLFLLVHRWWEGTRLSQRLAQARGLPRAVWLFCAWLLTFHAVCLAWAFFRLTTWVESVECLRKVVSFDSSLLLVGDAAAPALLLPMAGYGLYAALEHRLKGMLAHPEGGYRIDTLPPFLRGAAWGVAVMLIAMGLLMAPSGEAPAFIYFQF